jgi:hypothetical protein
MKLAEYEAVVFCIRMARKTGSTRVVNGVLRLVVGKEPLKPPAPGALIEVGVFDHHVDSSAIAFEDDSVLLLGLAQFVHDDRAVGEITGRVAVDRFWICEDVVHSLRGGSSFCCRVLDCEDCQRGLSWPHPAATRTPCIVKNSTARGSYN